MKKSLVSVIITTYNKGRFEIAIIEWFKKIYFI